MHDHSAPQLVQIAPLRPQPRPVQHVPHDHKTEFLVGVDVGSTTVKAVVAHAANDKVLWQDYQRHEAKQPEKTLEFLKRMEADAATHSHNTRMIVTGEAGGAIAAHTGAKLAQPATAAPL